MKGNIKELSVRDLPKEEQTYVKAVIQLVDRGDMQKALEIANKLRPEVQGLLPDYILYKFSQLSEMSGTGGGASFTAGTGEQYATPKAFNKKKVVRKSLKLKEILSETLGEERVNGVKAVNKLVALKKLITNEYNLPENYIRHINQNIDEIINLLI